MPLRKNAASWTVSASAIAIGAVLWIRLDESVRRFPVAVWLPHAVWNFGEGIHEGQHIVDGTWSKHLQILGAVGPPLYSTWSIFCSCSVGTTGRCRHDARRCSVESGWRGGPLEADFGGLRPQVLFTLVG